MKSKLPFRKNHKKNKNTQDLGDQLLALAVGAVSGKVVARLLPKRLRRLGVFAVPPVYCRSTQRDS